LIKGANRPKLHPQYAKPKKVSETAAAQQARTLEQTAALHLLLLTAFSPPAFGSIFLKKNEKKMACLIKVV